MARVAPWAEHPADPAATGAWTTTFLRGYADSTGIVAAIVRDGVQVGAVDAQVDPMAATAEVGYWLAPEAEGRGVARRAVEALVDHLVHRRGIRRVTAGIAPDNERSLALAGRIGLRLEATHVAALEFADRREDVLAHAVLAQDWVARRPGPGEELAQPVDDEIDLVLPEARRHDEVNALTAANLERLRPWESWAHHVDPARNAVWWQGRMRAWAEGDALPLLLRDRASDRVLGTMDARIDRGRSSAEIGYWVDGAAEGRGLVTRAARAVVAVLLDERGLRRVQLRTSTRNERSRAVAERLGMRHEGTLWEAVVVGGVPHDHDVFALVR